jgi:hypothetical protein
MLRPSHPHWLDRRNNIWWSVRSSSLRSIFQPPAIPSLLGSNILPSTLFSNALNLCYSLSVRDQFSHPFNTRGKIIVLYNLIFKFFREETGRQKTWTEGCQTVPN